MRILYLIHQFFPASQSMAEQVCLNLARSAQRSGHYVHVLAWAMQPGRPTNARPTTALKRCFRDTYRGIPITLMPHTMLPDSAEDSLEPARELAVELADWIASERFDIAHVMHARRNASALLAVQEAAIPYVITLTDFSFLCSRLNLLNASGQPCAGSEGGGVARVTA